MEIAGSSGLFVGGASGMCRATATKFAERGGNVAILDLEQSEGASVAESLGGKFYPCNVMDYDGMEAVMASAIGDLGSLHFMVNTAGGGVAQRTIKKDGTRHALSDFRRIIEFIKIRHFSKIPSIAKHHHPVGFDSRFNQLAKSRNHKPIRQNLVLESTTQPGRNAHD